MSNYYNQQNSGPVVQYSTHVPVIKSKTNVTVMIVVSFILSSIGALPWFIFLESLLMEELRFMNHLSAWVLTSGFSFAGLIFALSQMKVKGYQSQQTTLILWLAVAFAVVMSVLPVIAAALYGADIGN